VKLTNEYTSGWDTKQSHAFVTFSKKIGVGTHSRSAQIGNTVDVSENEYAVSHFEDKLAAVRKMEHLLK
jgi:hypothetical protein